MVRQGSLAEVEEVLKDRRTVRVGRDADTEEETEEDGQQRRGFEGRVWRLWALLLYCKSLVLEPRDFQA